jgi:hypothetical protein
MTLQPGDVILTDAGGIGPLLEGDQVEVNIEGIGTLRNPAGSSPAGRVDGREPDARAGWAYGARFQAGYVRRDSTVTCGGWRLAGDRPGDDEQPPHELCSSFWMQVWNTNTLPCRKSG